MSVAHRNIFLLLAITLVFTACQSVRLAPLCEKSFPEWANQLEAAQFALAPWLPQGLARMPAGLELRAGASPTGAQALDVRDRRVWSLWAQQRLQETQTYLDEMSKDPSRRDAFAKLSELANQYVVFIGFSERGDVRKMMGSLRRVSDISQQAKGTLCLKTRDFGPQACL